MENENNEYKENFNRVSYIMYLIDLYSSLEAFSNEDFSEAKESVRMKIVDLINELNHV